MTPERFERARELFEQAIELPESERSAFVTQRCGDDRELTAIVQSLLERARRQQAENAQIHARPADDRLVGAQIGPYRIRAAIGQGGMGAVYEAEHERTRQVVALKLIRPGLTAPALLRRFEFELQVLARLEHPGIARIYHADTADVGGGPQPYFAMELVRGQNLVEYALQQKLTIHQRLELAPKIADAVQYAHQQGVIHRDLKPGNIFVTAEGQPKILDFGVARATDSDVQSTTLQTDIGQLIGTLPYMSPEQAGGDPAQIDTRSDVYALGVVIYELLTGRLPYLLDRQLIHEVVRIIKEDEPTRLSILNKTLRGDVETIVGKALEKEKDRRYASANALAADIRRYLSDEPIAARPPSATYQISKFARRNKVLVGGVAATFVALTAGLATSIVFYRRADGQAERAKAAEIRERGERTRAETALREVTKSRDETRQVAEFQENMLAQIDPTTTGVRLTEDVNRRFAAALEELGVSEAERASQADEFRERWLRVNATDAALALINMTILQPAVKAIDTFKDQPVVDAQLRQVLATRYQELALYGEAMPLQQAALETRRRMLGNEHPDTLTSINNMGSLLQAQGKLDEAEPYYREALEKSRLVLGEEHPGTLNSINNMGLLLLALGRLDEAELYWLEALEKRRRVLGEEHQDTLTSINNIGGLLQEQGRLDEAEPYFREALEKSRRVRGEEHPKTLLSINNLGSLLLARGKLEDAEPYFREGLEKRRRVLGEEHPDTLSSINNMASLLQAQGKLAEAEPYYHEAVGKFRRVLGGEHPLTLTSISNMGFLLLAQGKLAEAEPYVREALEMRRRVLGVEHPDTLSSINNMGSLLYSQGKLEEAEPYFREVMERFRDVLGGEHPSTLTVINNLGFLLQAQGKYGEAVDLLAPAEAAARKVFTGGNSAGLAVLLQTLGKARAGLPFEASRFAAAEANLLEAHTILTQVRGKQDINIRDCTRGLIDLYNAWKKAEPEKAYDAKAAEWRAKLEDWQASTQPTATQPAVR